MSRLAPALLFAATVLTGCATTPIPATTPESARAVAPEAAALSPTTPTALSAGDQAQMSKLQAFITNQGLASTPAKLGQGARLTAAWNNKIIYAPDPTHGGDLVPGLLGKLWVFGPDESVPLVLDGELIVGVWDLSPKAQGGQPVLQEVWHIDAETAKKFRKKDFMGGEAYTVFLPWSRYHVDLKQVNLVARFNGPDGRNLVSSPETLTLDHSATLQQAKDKLNGFTTTGSVPSTDHSSPNVLTKGTVLQPTK